MAIVVVERVFDRPVTEAQMRSQHEDATCTDLYQVKVLWTYLATDGLRSFCAFEAPDAEAVRSLQRINNLPYERIWSADMMEANQIEAGRTAEPRP